MAQRKRNVGSDALATLDPGKLADLKLSLSEKEWRKIRLALVDMSTGIKVLTRLRRAGYGPDGSERVEVVSRNDDGAFDFEGYIYTLPPNPAAIRLLVEQNVGRAGTRETTKADTTVNLIHMVPRPDGIAKAEPSGEVVGEPEDDPGEALEIEPENPPLDWDGPVGYGAVEEPEYADDPGEEE